MERCTRFREPSSGFGSVSDRSSVGDWICTSEYTEGEFKLVKSDHQIFVGDLAEKTGRLRPNKMKLTGAILRANDIWSLGEELRKNKTGEREVVCLLEHNSDQVYHSRLLLYSLGVRRCGVVNKMSYDQLAYRAHDIAGVCIEQIICIRQQNQMDKRIRVLLPTGRRHLPDWDRICGSEWIALWK